MPKRVLDVGQCSPDHASIRWLIEREFNAQVVRTQGLEDTLAELARGPVDLVLVNRKLDADYSDGMDVLRSIKGDSKYGSTPVMLVSNYPEYQAEAIAAGGEPGFGKAQLQRPETVEALRKFLG
jgi:DNA-binding NarL/FixJ family response regulator